MSLSGGVMDESKEFEVYMSHLAQGLGTQTGMLD